MRTYTLTITEDTEKNVWNFASDNRGFSGTEIVAFLEMKKADLIKQLTDPAKFDRVARPDGSVHIEEMKGEN